MYKPLKAETDDWNTGDLILFQHKNSCFGKVIKYFTGSDYTHVGIILRNPDFLKTPLVGLFFWESSDENYPDVEDHKKKLGVEIVDLGELINRVGSIKLFYRKLTLNSGFTIDNARLKEMHEEEGADNMSRAYMLAREDELSRQQRTQWASSLLKITNSK